MTRLEKLYDELHTENITVYDYHFSKTKKAACFKDGEHETIILDRAAVYNSAEEYSLVAEEYAHYETNSLYELNPDFNESYSRMMRIAAEGKAKRHAITRHIPFEKMDAVFERFVYADGLDIYELAEYFEMTPEFAIKAIEHYHNQGMKW